MARNTAVLLSILVLVLVAGTATVLADGKGEGHATHGAKMTVHGEVLDMACFLAHGAKGPEHAACAKRCVKGGQPMGLLAEDGTVYLLYASHDDDSAFQKTKDLAGQNVEINGVAATQAGIDGIEVHAVKPL